MSVENKLRLHDYATVLECEGHNIDNQNYFRVSL